MGANIAKEVADEKFCETTIGNYCKGQIIAAIFSLTSSVAGKHDGVLEAAVEPHCMLNSFKEAAQLPGSLVLAWSD